MKPKLFQQVDGVTQKLVPATVAFLLVILTVVPLQIPGYAAVTPVFTLMAVYHWTIYRPDLLPSWTVFLIGAAQDLLTGGPIGVSSLVLLVSQALVVRQRRFFVGKLFPFVWWGFLVLTVIASVLTYACGSLLSRALLDMPSAAFQAVLTVALYPIVSWFFVRGQRAAGGRT
jgi:rod shape-determining protein MreD